MTALDLIDRGSLSGSGPESSESSPHLKAGYWPNRKENVKDRQDRKCLFCGRPQAKHRPLEIHHVRKIEHGGTDAFMNLIAVCHACHNFVHNVERDMPAISRVILALQILGPRESALLTWVCRFLFRVFLRSPAGTSFHPAALQLRRVSAVSSEAA